MAETQLQTITLALQGGGTHGAFTWGAIDRLLQDDDVDIQAITATSGGALQAVVLASGLIENKQVAREKMQLLWRKISTAASMMPLQPRIMDKFLSHVGMDFSASSVALDTLTRFFSPYQFNLFDFNPLREIIKELVDFKALHRAQFPVYVNATHTLTGEVRIFSGNELTVESVLAAACLPFVFKTVEIEGIPYWDGAYSANPALSPLLTETLPADVVLIHTVPGVAEDIPRQPADILDHATELSFHAAYMRECERLEAYNAGTDAAKTLHIIEASEFLSSLGRASKLNADWDFLVHLYETGQQAAADWRIS